jgi:hypothetical protein
VLESLEIIKLHYLTERVFLVDSLKLCLGHLSPIEKLSNDGFAIEPSDTSGFSLRDSTTEESFDDQVFMPFILSVAGMMGALREASFAQKA